MNKEPVDEHGFYRRLYVFSVSAGMVGVCFTGISLLAVVSSLKKLETIGDEVLLATALLFLGSAVLSFLATLPRWKLRRGVLDQVADYLFFAALVLLLVVGLIIVVALG